MHPAADHATTGGTLLFAIGDISAHGLQSLGGAAASIMAVVYLVRALDGLLAALPGRIRSIRAAWDPDLGPPVGPGPAVPPPGAAGPPGA